VGTHFQQFDRLVRSMDEYAKDRSEEVVIQAGFSKYEPSHARWFRFVETDEEMDRLYKDADVIVAHGGAGTAITALRLNKPLVILPRLARY
jgi:UDP-N-acetylglucosamine transferase subunit ALG13